MHRFCSYFLLFLFPFLLKAQSNFDKFTRETITGNRIKSITEWSHSYQGGSPVREGRKNARASYDRNGNLLEEITYNTRGEETRKVTNGYDSRSNRIENSVYEARFSKITYSQFSQYDQTGKKLAEWGFDGLGNYRNNFTLDRSGMLMEISYLTQNTLAEKRVYKTSGRETEISVLSQGKTLSYKIFLRYNEQGRLLEEKTIDAGGKQLKRVLFEYNPDGQIRTETRYHASILGYVNRYRYDSRGRLVEIEKQEQESKPVITNMYVFSQEGNLSEEHWYSESVKDYSVKKYSYDRKGTLSEVDAFFISYNFRVLYKYTFQYY